MNEEKNSTKSSQLVKGRNCITVVYIFDYLPSLSGMIISCTILVRSITNNMAEKGQKKYSYTLGTMLSNMIYVFAKDHIQRLVKNK